MASGASSPELLCTIVSLFITHSSLGLGTIVGSEIFNLLIICAGSVYASKIHEVPHEKYGSRYLVLDKIMLLREVTFYGLSIGLLYVALSESAMVIAQDGNNKEATEQDIVVVSFWKSCLVFGEYILYVVFCSNMTRIINTLKSVRVYLGFDSVDQVAETHDPETHIGSAVTPSSVHYKVTGL